MTQHYENLDATFQDLHDAGGLERRVYASDLNTKHIREFSTEEPGGQLQLSGSIVLQYDQCSGGL
jgi:hypothetical protein